MTKYEPVQQILDNAIGRSNVQIGVHGAFWRGLTRDQFIAKRIRGLARFRRESRADHNLSKG
jgi:hypothetical protein